MMSHQSSLLPHVRNWCVKPGVPDEDKDITEEKVILEWGDEQDSEFFDDDNDDVEKDDKDGNTDDEGNDHISDTQDADDEDDETEFDEDDIYKFQDCALCQRWDVVMKDGEVESLIKLDQPGLARPRGEELKSLSLLRSNLTTKETPKGKGPTKGSKLVFDRCLPMILLQHMDVLEYLKTSDPEVTYTTSITKTKAARYEIKGIKDMVPTLWSSIKHAYDKDAEKGIKHWGERRKLCVKKLHGHCHLEEIMVKRSDQQFYKFKEGEFVDLTLNDH
ncbi:hypothetical protein Tco_0831347 [Tanacetum coccineum]